MENTGNNNKKSKAKKWLFGGLGLLALGTLTFFGIDYYTKNKSKKTVPAKPKVKAPVKKQAPAKPKNKVTTKPKAATKTAPKKETPKQEAPKQEATFPLKKGDSGTLVKSLQEALIKTFGANFLPIEGANGTFGNELEAALIKLRLPTINGQIRISESTYTRFVYPEASNPSAVADLIRSGIGKKNFERVMIAVKTIRNKQDYKQTADSYLRFYTNGVRKTLVTALFSTFTESTQQQQIRSELLRIGLAYDGQKWTLNGMKNDNLIITTQATTVWKDAKTSVPVPVNMVLGNEITKRGDFTLFENDKQHFLVESKTVKAYNQ